MRGPEPRKALAACRPDHTHGCPLSLRAEEAKREARQVPPATCRLVVGTAFSCSVRPTGLVSRPQPHATPRTFDEAAHLSQLPSRPQRLQGLREQARVLAWGDREGLWRGCVWRGAWPCGLSLGLACSPGRGASHSARWGGFQLSSGSPDSRSHCSRPLVCVSREACGTDPAGGRPPSMAHCLASDPC